MREMKTGHTTTCYLRDPLSVSRDQCHGRTLHRLGLRELVEPGGLRHEEEVHFSVRFLVVTLQLTQLFCQGLVLDIRKEELCAGNKGIPLRLQQKNRYCDTVSITNETIGIKDDDKILSLLTVPSLGLTGAP